MKKKRQQKATGQFFGTTTLGKKGQIVIPAEARTIFHLQEGEKLLVFGTSCGLIALAKLEQAEELASLLSERLTAIRRPHSP